jgi:hypothetical protein
LQFSEPVPLGPKEGNAAERRAIDRYGNASRITITDAQGAAVGEATISISGGTVYVPWLGGVGMAGGEGRGRAAVFGHREILNLAERVAEIYPDAIILKYTPSEGRNKAGVERVLDLDRARQRLAKRAGEQTVEPKPEPVKSPPPQQRPRLTGREVETALASGAEVSDRVLNQHPSLVVKHLIESVKWKHGTYDASGNTFEAFDPSRYGSATGASSAKEGIFLTDNPATAESYMVGNEYDSLVLGEADLAPHRKMLEVAAKVKNPIVLDAHGRDIEVVFPGEDGGFTSWLQMANRQGHESALERRVID